MLFKVVVGLLRAKIPALVPQAMHGHIRSEQGETMHCLQVAIHLQEKGLFVLAPVQGPVAPS